MDNISLAEALAKISDMYLAPVEVGESDGLGEALVHQLLHLGPGLQVVALHVRAVVTLHNR